MGLTHVTYYTDLWFTTSFVQLIAGQLSLSKFPKASETSVLMFSGDKEREKGPGMGLEAALNSSSVK